MRNSKTLARLANDNTVRLCALGHFLPHFVRHASLLDYDCIWLDLEHRAMSTREVQGLMAFFHLYDIDCMLRPPTREKARLYRYLEDGATGLMIPHVSTAEEARSLVQSVKFPPLGNRGIDGAGMDCDFQLAGPEYVEQANQQTFLVVQIETPQAVNVVDEIAAVDGVDGMFVGPGDLQLRLRTSDNEMTLESAIERVAAAAAAHGKHWGCPVSSADDLQHRRDQGGRILARGGDFLAVIESLQQCRQDFGDA